MSTSGGSLACLLHRFSCRSFAPTPLPSSVLISALEHARAPSAGNLQAWQVVAVTTTSGRSALAAACSQSWIKTSPCVLVFLADAATSAAQYGERGASLFSVQDATLAAGYTALALDAQGVSSAWVGAFHEEEIGSLLGIPADMRTIAIIPTGYAAEPPGPPTSRRPVAELLHWERFKEQSKET